MEEEKNEKKMRIFSRVDSKFACLASGKNGRLRLSFHKRRAHPRTTSTWRVYIRPNAYFFFIAARQRDIPLLIRLDWRYFFPARSV